jgi:uncharacterized protein (DUF1697 family)
MARTVVLLRGINIGPRNRIAMPELRALLEDAGFGAVETYVQSGNAVLATRLKPAAVEARVEQAIVERLGLEIPVVARTRDELAAVVALDPLAGAAADPKRYQVTFLAAEPAPEAVERLESLRAGEERFAVHGRELYAWHPAGVARSKLAAALADKRLGVKATARNWTTVTTLLELAGR